MSTSAQVVRAALRRINVVSREEEVDPGDALDGIDALNAMIASWANKGVRLQSDVPLPARHKDGIIALLAVRLAPEFGKTPSQLLLADAEAGWEGLQADYIRAPRSRFDGALTSFPSQRYAQDGSMDFPSWKPNTGFSVSDQVANQGRIYECTVGGVSASNTGPVTTGSAEVDGTVTWAYKRTL